MIDRFGYYALGVLVAFLHVSFFSEVTIFGFDISVLLIALLLIILQGSKQGAYKYAIAAGIVVDFNSPAPFGVNVLTLLGLVMLNEVILRSFFERTSFLARVSVMMLAVFATFLFKYALFHMFFGMGVTLFRPDVYMGTGVMIFGVGILNTVLLLLTLSVITRADDFLQNKVYQRSRYRS